MDGPQSNATLLNPEVLLHLLLYTSPTQQATTQLAPACWIDFDTAFGPYFQPGTEHQVSLLTANYKSTPYKVVVASPPVLGQMPNPEQENALVPTATIYLLPKSVHPVDERLQRKVV
ncbi:hypothetical protein [Spirosoma foliorum]|uniref:Uncharacterized protein n=1 Tax=Spirosoma foliorum TaxID=2710596 RepID=A0A7G5H6M7_9BACT|nr:hypothetical protein [Spirosoma foliorum]QMW06769.1 hypothetical protein H3H32_18685 [Spirosoma foliorum]